MMMCAGFRKGTILALALVCACFCAAVGFPLQAFAWLDQVTDKYYAGQDISTSGDVLTGADVPEGTYSVEAETNSSMCLIKNAVLTSAGGELWLTFSMSGAYNALSFGSAEEAVSYSLEATSGLKHEEAASLAPEDYYAPYYQGNPLEGYVAHSYSIPIPALNYEFPIATYTGGKGTEGGVWWSRIAIVHSRGEVDDAIAGASGGDEEPSGGDDSGADPSGGDDSGSQETDPGEGSESEPYDDGSASGDGDSDSSEADKDEEPEPSTTSIPTSVANTNTTGAGNNVGNTPNEESNTPEEEKSASSADASSKAAAKKAAKNAKIGKAIRFVSPDEVILEKELPDIEAQKVEAEQKQSSMTALALIFTLINTALAGAFVVGLRNSKPRSRGLTR